MSVESPYRPPREVDPAEVSSMPLDPGVFRFAPEEQRVIGKLAKYLRDIGGLLIFLAVLACLALFVSGFTVFSVGVRSMAGLQVAQQAMNVVFLFLIGRFMRQAASPLQAASEAPDGHIENFVSSMVSLKSLYGTKILFVLVGIVVTILTLVF